MKESSMNQLKKARTSSFACMRVSSSALSGFKLDRLSLMMKPAAENSDSDATLVAWMAR